MNRKWKLRTVSVLVAASLLAAACGDDDEATDADTEPTGQTDGSADDIAADDGGPLVVGVYEQLQANELAAVLGDPRIMDPATVDYVNANGGAGGRQIRLVTAALDATLATPVPQQNQAACTKFAEDEDATFVINPSVPTPDFVECLVDNGIIDIMSAVTMPDEATINDARGLIFGPSFINQDRLGRLMADVLVEEGFLEDGANVGVLYSDHAHYRAGADAFKERAADSGATFTDVTICLGCSAQQSTNEAQNGIVRLRDADVDRVVLIDLAAAQIYFTAASAADFTPRLGLSSNIIPAALAPTVPELFPGAVGPGFIPATDVNASEEPEQTQPMRDCAELMAAAGAPAATRVAVLHQRVTCDGFFFVKAVLDATGGDASREAVLAAVEDLGDSYVSANTWKTSFGPDKLDGAAVYRVMEYVEACACMQYTSDELPITQ